MRNWVTKRLRSHRRKRMTHRVFASGLSRPEGPVMLDDDRIALVEMGDDRKSVTIVSSDGQRTTLIEHVGNPNGLAMDGDGCFWVAGGPGQSLIRLSPSSAILARINGDGERDFLWPNDLAFGPDGHLYMTDSGIAPEVMMSKEAETRGFRNLHYDGRVYRIDPKRTKVVDRIAGGILFANGVAFGADGALYYNETLSGLVFRVELGGRPEAYANVIRSFDPAQFKGPDGMAFAADGTLYCAVMGEGHVCVVAPNGAVETWLETPCLSPTNLAFDLTEDVICITEYARGEIEIMQVGRRGLALHAPSVGISANSSTCVFALCQRTPRHLRGSSQNDEGIGNRQRSDFPTSISS
jgi:gluconolactonase